jgi:hypothetical protein
VCSNSDHIAPRRLFPAEYHTLRVVEVFTGDRIGAAGITPGHLTAWRELLVLENGDECFKNLVAHATLAGQLYGLAGVYFTDQAGLETLATPYRTHGGTVMTIITCVVGEIPVREIVERIVSGALPKQLRGPIGPG